MIEVSIVSIILALVGAASAAGAAAYTVGRAAANYDLANRIAVLETKVDALLAMAAKREQALEEFRYSLGQFKDDYVKHSDCEERRKDHG